MCVFLTKNIFQRQGLCVVLQISSWSAVSDLLQNNGRWQRGVETTRPGSAAPSMSDEETPYCQQPEYASSSILVCSVLQTRVGLSKCLAASWWHGIVGPFPPSSLCPEMRDTRQASARLCSGASGACAGTSQCIQQSRLPSLAASYRAAQGGNWGRPRAA